MFKQMAKKLSQSIIDKPLPPLSEGERIALAELQATFQELPVVGTEGALPTEAVWLTNMNRIRELVLHQDAREFLRWDVISETMYVDHSRYVPPELRYLKRRPDWDSRWRPAIRELPVGHPNPYILHPASSGILIHHAYHLAQFEENTGEKTDAMDFVLEFGGGYGSMARLFYNLGFRGTYVIFDLPPFSALQKYYLQSGGFPVCSLPAPAATGEGIFCLSDFEQLRAFLQERRGDLDETLFLATWSISETPIRFRESVLSLVSTFKAFLIGYRDTFGEVDNVAFFDKWQQTHPDIRWHSWPIEQIPGNRYLMGKTAR